MKFSPTKVDGAFSIDLDRRTDERGFFARVWCEREFAEHGISMRLPQINMSHNRMSGTLRGMHFQEAPHEEGKVVSCMHGAIFDVVLDLRPQSPTYMAWDAVELSEQNGRMLYLPEGCAHGFQTLVDETRLLYLMSEFYAPGHARGVRYDDPAFSIEWPRSVTCISDADRNWPTYSASRRPADSSCA